MIRVMLVGNPNCGKTTIFNACTNEQQSIGNWPGVTVEKKVGNFIHNGQEISLTDLPGVYSLNHRAKSCAIDEQISALAILDNDIDVFVNVIDATNLERSLFLTSQLIELGKPVVLALNMTDLSANKGIVIDDKQLAKFFNSTVVLLNANKKVGVLNLKNAVINAHARKLVPKTLKINFNDNVINALDSLRFKLQQSQIRLPSRLIPYISQRFLEGDNLLAEVGYPNLALDFDCQGLDIIAMDMRYGAINHIAQKIITINTERKAQPFSSRLDKILLNRFLGLPIFFLIMYAMFYFAIDVVSVVQDLFNKISDAIFVTEFNDLLSKIPIIPIWLRELVVNGVGTGISTTLTFIPVLFSMYFCLSWLELSGYMTRVAFLVDRFMQFLGLPGKAFLPMIIGFGCNVPAIMATRTLNSSNERFLTILISPFMSCSARLAIYAVFVAAFFERGGHNIVFLLYLIGIIMAIMTGFLFKKTLFNQKRTPLILELSAYHRPGVKRLFKETLRKLQAFIFRAGKVIIPVCCVLAILNIKPQELGFLGFNDETLLSYMGKHLTPLFMPMGISEQNWPATVGLVTGMMAKEVVIGTLNSLYQTLDASSSIYGAISQYFDGKAGAFAYLLFVLLYVPCVSTIAVIRQEATRKIMWLSIVWSFLVAYSTASIFYQIATFFRHPLQTIILIGLFLLLLSLFIIVMYYKGGIWFKDAINPAANGCKPCGGCSQAALK